MMLEREGSPTGCQMSTTEVPSDDENTYIFGHLKVECNGVPWGGQACIILCERLH